MNSFNDKIKLYTAVITPFDIKLELDLSVLENLVEFQIKNGVDGLLICGTTGEFPSLTVSEVISIAKYVYDIKKDLELIVGIGRNSIKETIELAVGLDEYADAFLISPPFYYNFISLKGLFEYYTRILEKIRTSVILYDIPKYTNIEIPFELVEDLLKFDNFMGIKDSKGDINKTKMWKDNFPNIKVYMGSDALIYEGLENKIDGIISAISNIFPDKIRKLIIEFEENNESNSRSIQNEVLEIRNILKEHQSIAAIKSLIHWRDLTPLKLRVRPPLTDLTSDEDLLLYNKLRKWFK
ncbi:MAG: dihydrodipicolinate synthase family protein [Candidatus Helarchaeota archaeon]